MRILVVGGVAGGMSFAARARRLSEEAEIVVFERGPYVSFANCGLPYYLGGDISERDALLLHTPRDLAESLNLDVRVHHEVMSIDPDSRTIVVRSQSGTRTEPYDVLVLSTGSTPVVPPIDGLERSSVARRTVTLRDVPDADRIESLIDEGARTATVLGGGFIGLEVAEALSNRGLRVSLIDLAEQVLTPLDPEMARPVEHELKRAGVATHLGRAAKAIGDHDVVLTDETRLPADLVILAAGVNPDTALARAAGLQLGLRGAVRVDTHGRTSDPHIWAVGDAVEVKNAVTDHIGLVPLAGLANRQGRAVADRLFGRAGDVPAALGTAIVRVFGLTAAMTGASEKVLVAQNRDFRKIYLHPNDHAGYFPGAEQIHLKVLFSPDGQILGAQAVGRAGVDKRIDVLATAIRAGLRVTQLAELELAYSPPYGSAKDAVNMVGFMAQNLLRGDVTFWYPEDFSDLPNDALVLDVRTPNEHEAGALAGSVLIPHTELRQRLGELPRDRAVYAYCASGFRSYLAARVLAQNGYRVFTLAGGMATMEAWLEVPGDAIE